MEGFIQHMLSMTYLHIPHTTVEHALYCPLGGHHADTNNLLHVDKRNFHHVGPEVVKILAHKQMALQVCLLSA